METYEFMSNLSFMGWIGLTIMLAYPLLVLINHKWFFDWEERLPKWDAMEDYFYTEPMQFAFLIGRFILGWVIFFIIGKIFMLF